MNKEKFSNRLKYLRLNKNVSLRKLSKEVRIPHTTLSGYEKGRIPDKERLIKLANYFNVSIDFLSGENDKIKINKNLGVIFVLVFIFIAVITILASAL
ncbi:MULTISPECIES: helix-turn-helix domain-containing protein [Gemella]|uniref:helix-turn-helix domain-containing protein n=1 Tax=Gemella TaxID=1378 RepID=UPI00076833A7|nr:MULTISPECIES: helix-turn-helix transcriptional regulator [Gemella]AME09678.1 hypothetical protein AXE85_05690 [Gemella sp. oral taxon 928]